MKIFDLINRHLLKLLISFNFQSWEALPADTATFTPDITPLILAAHTDNYEVIINDCTIFVMISIYKTVTGYCR